MIQLIIFIAILLTSCGSPSVKTHSHGERIQASADDGNTRLEINLLSPDEPGWFRKRLADSIITLQKGEDSPDENQEIEAYIISHNTSFGSTQNFIEKTKQNIQKQYEKNQEYRLQKLDVKKYPENNLCIVIYVLLEDLRSGETSKPKKWSEQHALSCVFPIHQSMGFEIRYYQRCYKNNCDDQFSRKAQALFKSLEIVDRQRASPYTQMLLFFC